MQIKIPMTYHYTPTRMVNKHNKTKHTHQSAHKDSKQMELSYIVGCHAKWYSHLENKLAVFYEVKHTLITWPSTPTGCLPKRNENLCSQKNLIVKVYNNFIMAKNWKQPNCPSIGKWMNKLVHITDYHSVIKGNDYWYMQQHGSTTNTLC